MDCLASPLTLLPLGAGLSLFIVAWVLPKQRELLTFAGVACLLVGLGVLMSLWLVFSGGDPQLAQMRKTFAESLEAAYRLERGVLPEEAKHATTPAVAESP
jgi:hypothetical protein